MATDAQRLALKAYAQRVRDARRAHAAITEPGLAPEFQRLVVDLLPTLLAAPLTVVPEFRNPQVGRPDIALTRPGQFARAFIELKSADKPTDGQAWRTPHDARQFNRFCELAHWAISNFHEFRLYERKDAVGHATVVPEAALDPVRTDPAVDRLLDAHDPDPFLRLLERLAQAQPPAAATAEQLAELLAFSARLVRGIVKDRLAELNEEKRQNTPLQQVRQEFRDVLYSHPEAAGYSNPDFDELFSAAFAQTLAFGLLLVREATGRPVGHHAADHMPTEHPLMKTALQVLSMEPVAREIGAGFDVMLDTVNGFEPQILAVGFDGQDPILYFYENFLETFDHKARERFGVYYTPVQIVRYMVGALDRTLRQSLGTAGLADENVHILDPATGTGTYLLGIADRLRRDVARREGPGQTPPAIRGLAARMYGFELLVGPYAVAHYRLHHALSRNLEGAPKVTGLPRLGVYLTDTLARPGSAAPLGPLGFVSEGIRDERLESNRIKTEQPILAIIGNPPYRRLEVGENETLVGQWMDALWDDLKKPVRDAGQGNQLNTFPELSVAFWRWAIWKLFEAENAPRRGVVAFITNRKFLTGWPYAGLRKMMRERFDRIEVIDLRGDVRRGERAGVGADQGVFNIQVGTAITLAIADGRKAPDALAEVRYNDAWAHDFLSRRDKFEWLVDGEDDGALYGEVTVERGPLEDFRPTPFFNGELISVQECFAFGRSGLQSKRDEFVYDTSRVRLATRIQAFMTASDKDSASVFHDSRDLSWRDAKLISYSDRHLIEVSYRPLDRRFLYNHRNFGDYLRQELQQVWGDINFALYTMPSGTGAGPAVWCHGLLPDYHAFRGSYGGYAFPLFDRRPGHGPFNVKADLMEALGAAYGGGVTPEAVFDAILCLLSARSYTTRFAEDLEDTFPHIPFPAARALFEEAAILGAEIRLVETFGRPPRVNRALGRAETAPTGPLAPVEWASGEIRLCADGSGHISNIPAAVWEFAVSGYRLLPRWLAAREGLAIGPTFIPELRDVAARIAELIDLFDAADSILVRTLDAPLSRAALGLKVQGAS
jgi:hypothetical protein